MSGTRCPAARQRRDRLLTRDRRRAGRVRPGSRLVGCCLEEPQHARGDKLRIIREMRSSRVGTGSPAPGRSPAAADGHPRRAPARVGPAPWRRTATVRRRWPPRGWRWGASSMARVRPLSKAAAWWSRSSGVPSPSGAMAMTDRVRPGPWWLARGRRGHQGSTRRRGTGPRQAGPARLRWHPPGPRPSA